MIFSNWILWNNCNWKCKLFETVNFCLKKSQNIILAILKLSLEQERYWNSSFPMKNSVLMITFSNLKEKLMANEVNTYICHRPKAKQEASRET